MSTLLYLLTLAGILAIGMAIVIVVVTVFLWMRYRTSIAAAQQIEFLIETNRATARPRVVSMCVGPPESDVVEDAHAR